MRAVLVLLLSAVLGTNASAIMLLGKIPCGGWVQARAQAHSESRSAAEFWLLGFLSGKASGQGIDVLKGVEPASLELWMDNYCKSHPLDFVQDGAQTLYEELVQRHKERTQR